MQPTKSIALYTQRALFHIPLLRYFELHTLKTRKHGERCTVVAEATAMATKTASAARPFVLTPCAFLHIATYDIFNITLWKKKACTLWVVSTSTGHPRGKPTCAIARERIRRPFARAPPPPLAPLAPAIRLIWALLNSGGQRCTYPAPTPNNNKKRIKDSRLHTLRLHSDRNYERHVLFFSIPGIPYG